MASLDFYTDDYKRPEGSAEQLGIFATQAAAKTAGVTEAFNYNVERMEIGEPDEQYLRSETEPRKRARLAEDERQQAYIDIARSVKDVDFEDVAAAEAFDKKHREALEAFLGESEFGVKSSGARPLWKFTRSTDLDPVMKNYEKFWAVFDANANSRGYVERVHLDEYEGHMELKNEDDGDEGDEDGEDEE